MLERTLSGPQIGILAGTRVALGIGIGLLISRRLSADQCKGAGLALTIMGALTTIPIVAEVISQNRDVKKLQSVA